MTTEIREFGDSLEELLSAHLQGGQPIAPRVSAVSGAFAAVKRKHTGYWAPVDQAIAFLSECADKGASRPVLSSAVQGLHRAAGLCLGVSLRGVEALRDRQRCGFAVPHPGNLLAGETTIVWVIRDCGGIQRSLASLASSGGCRMVALILAEELPSGLPAEIHPIRLSPDTDLVAAFELAYYLSGTEYFVLACDELPGLQALCAGETALRNTPYAVSVFFDPSDRGGGSVLWSSACDSVQGIYRTRLVGSVGSFDSLFTKESYLYEDYQIRAGSLGYAVGVLPCGATAKPGCFPRGAAVNRDTEAMLRKHGKPIQERPDTELISSILDNLPRERAGQTLRLYYGGSGMVAKTLEEQFRYESGGSGACRMIPLSDGFYEKSDLIIICTPIDRIHRFDEIVTKLAEERLAKSICFFAENHLAAARLKDALADAVGTEREVSLFTVWYRRVLRERIEAFQYRTTLTRILQEVPENVQTAVKALYPDVCDTILRNLQTRYYLYVCELTEGSGV